MISKEMNILVTLDKNYISQLNVMLYSLFKSNPDSFFNIYLLNKAIDDSDLAETRRIVGEKGSLISLKAGDIGLERAPTTSRYPEEIYYRIFAAKYLPNNIDRVLYLDPDIIVNGLLDEIYNFPMEDYFFAAASHTGTIMTAVNSLRLDMDENAPYINSGVMIMNLSLLRKEQDFDEVFSFIEKRKALLILPDQDIISSLYGSRIYALDTYRYNMTELLYMMHSPFEKRLNLEWVRNNSVIIHYCGRNKPWKDSYIGFLDVFYNEIKQQLLNELRQIEGDIHEKTLKREDILTVPNLLSFARLLMIPFIIWTYCGIKDYTAALILILISGLTDIADGFIARRFNMISDFGKIIDPIADKATQLSVLICLSSRYKCIIALIVVLAVKEIYMGIAGYFAIIKKNTVNSAKWYGKLCTVVLYVTMILLVFFPELNVFAVDTLIAASIITAVFALIMYARFYNSIFDKDRLQ